MGGVSGWTAGLCASGQGDASRIEETLFQQIRSEVVHPRTITEPHSTQHTVPSCVE